MFSSTQPVSFEYLPDHLASQAARSRRASARSRRSYSQRSSCRQSSSTLRVVCAKFSKSVRGGGLAELRSKLASLCSIGQSHPFVPTCPPAERRAQPRSRLAAGHRRRRRAAVWTAASTVLG